MYNSQGPKDYKTLKKDKFIKDVNHPLVTKNYTMVTANQYALDSNKACCGYDVFDVKTNESIAYVKFQNGPIKENGVNGIANEDAILMVIDRLNAFQKTKYACEENAQAIDYLEKTLIVLRRRTDARIKRGVEGRNIV